MLILGTTEVWPVLPGNQLLHASTICRFRNPYHKRNQASSNAALWWMRPRLIHDFYHCSFVICSINTSFSVKNKASIAKTVNEAWLSMFISCLCEITWKKNRNMLKNENYSIKKWPVYVDTCSDAVPKTTDTLTIFWKTNPTIQSTAQLGVRLLLNLWSHEHCSRQT